MAGPQTLGRYQIERVLGKGAMGVVYEALDPKLRRKVAIKTILISQLDEETAKDFSMRFVREAHAVARLNHPNIVQVYDFGEEGEVAYIVMEFIRGNELKSALATSSTFDRKESVRIMCELLDALDFAHEQGVIHRDIKPANVMLDTQGRVKLTDFGVARVTDADRTNAERTQAGTMVGTPAYMSPEQIQGHRVDRRSDIFSAGIILYQLLTGQKPFTGDGAWTVAKKIIQDEPPTPSSLNVAVSPQLDRVTAKALAKLPDDRYPTAREFAGALRSAAEGKAAVEAEATVLVPREAEPSQAMRSGEMELEYWRSIKDSDDPNDFELYLQQFPKGVYASLAGRRAARLRGLPVEGGAESSDTRRLARSETTGSQERLARGEPGSVTKGGEERSVVEKTVKLPGRQVPAPEREPEAQPVPRGKRSPLLVPVLLGLIAAAGVAGYFAMRPGVQPPVPAAPALEAGGKKEAETAEKAKQEAEAQAARKAEAKAQQEAAEKARNEAEMQARREAEAKAQREAELTATRESEAKTQKEAEARAGAQRKAEAAKRDAAAKAQRDAELAARRAAEAKAQKEAETRARAQREAEASAKREAEVRVKREAEAKAKLEKTRVEEEKRIAAEKARVEKQKRAEEERAQRAREAELAKKKRDAEPKRPVIVPPSF